MSAFQSQEKEEMGFSEKIVLLDGSAEDEEESRSVKRKGNRRKHFRSLFRLPFISIIVSTFLVLFSVYMYISSRNRPCDRDAVEDSIELDLYWEDDDSLVQGDDSYSREPILLRSTPSDNVHDMPIVYVDSTLLDDVDLSQRSSCGVSKCFWPSVSDPDIGYVLTAEEYYDGLVYAYDLTQEITEKCGVHYLIPANTPPVLVNVTEEYMTKLARSVFNPSRHNVGQKSPWVFYPKDTVVTVQKVIRAPTPNLLYGTGGTKWEAMVGAMPEFRGQLDISLAELQERLTQEIERIECIFQFHPTYWLDFQGLIDTKGNFYHMDIDENYYTTPRLREQNKREQESCLDDFRLMVEGLTQRDFDETLLLDDLV